MSRGENCAIFRLRILQPFTLSCGKPKWSLRGNQHSSSRFPRKEGLRSEASKSFNKYKKTVLSSLTLLQAGQDMHHHTCRGRPSSEQRELTELRSMSNAGERCETWVVNCGGPLSSSIGWTALSWNHPCTPRLRQHGNVAPSGVVTVLYLCQSIL